MRATDDMVLKFIKTFLKDYGYAPSIKEIAAGLGLRSTSAVYHHLRRLEGRGSIQREAKIARAIRVLA